MDFSVLGPLAVRVDGVPVELRRGLPRALLTFLLLRRRTAVGVDVIADRLWAGQPPADRPTRCIGWCPTCGARSARAARTCW
jgi:DNA-binding SARP family transcriptional activator